VAITVQLAQVKFQTTHFHKMSRPVTATIWGETSCHLAGKDDLPRNSAS